MKVVLSLFLISICLTFSHELWIEKEGSSYVLYYGHLNPEGGEERLIKYNPETVLKFECFDRDGVGVIKKFEKQYPAKLNAQCYVVYALLSSGYWTKTLEGVKNKPKDETKESLESWLSYESVKMVDKWNDAVKKPITAELEIVPLEDPTKLKVGDKITLAVYQNGKPAKGVPVAYKGKTIGITDEEGKINIRIKHKGLQIISASLKEKGDGKKADYVVKTTYLTFEVK